MTEPYEFSATVAIKKIKEKKLSVHEWISSCLKRIKEKEPKLHAWAYLDDENALKKAKEYDQLS